jgi:hypothetical protein
MPMCGVQMPGEAGQPKTDRPKSANVQQRKPPLRRVLLVLAVAVVVCGIGFEVGARLYWRSSYRLELSETDRVLYAFYPGLRMIDRVAPQQTDRNFDILILAGSVLQPGASPFAADLLDQLTVADYRNVQIYNLALPAHTSRDSLHKYRALGDARFDLVIFYHGINEARANNIPPEHYRDDYSHYFWYGTVNTVAPDHGAASLATPYTLRSMAVWVRQILNVGRYIPTHDPWPYWLQFGRNIRSAKSFDQNFVDILELADRRGDRFLPITFATYIPADYSLEKFQERSLDYRMHRLSIEEWGQPEDVMKTVAAHNSIVKQRGAEHGVQVVDLAATIEPSGANFNDVCHLSRAGSAFMAATISAAIGPKGGDSKPSGALP